MLSAMLGHWGGFLTMIGVLLIQCLFFADGGLLALGCNVWNMAFYGCFVGALLIWRPIMRGGADKKKITAASVIGCIVTLQLGAFSVVLETALSGITELPFKAFAAAMQPIHLAIGLVEGLITAAVLCFVYEARPALLWGVEDSMAKTKEKMSLKKTLGILGAAAAAIGGILALFASSLPDGLEWAIGRLTGAEEVESTGRIYDLFAGIQQSSSFLPDYSLPGSESAAGTTVSGLAGALIVAVVCVLVCFVFRFYRKRTA